MKANGKRPTVRPRNRPKEQEGFRVPYRRDHLQNSPHSLGAAMSAFEHGLFAPKVSLLLSPPPSNPELTAQSSRFATNIDASTRRVIDIIAARGAGALASPSTAMGTPALVVTEAKGALLLTSTSPLAMRKTEVIPLCLQRLGITIGRGNGRRMEPYQKPPISNTLLPYRPRHFTNSATASCSLLETRLEDFIESPLVLDKFATMLRSSHSARSPILSRGSR